MNSVIWFFHLFIPVVGPRRRVHGLITLTIRGVLLWWRSSWCIRGTGMPALSRGFDFHLFVFLLYLWSCGEVDAFEAFLHVMLTDQKSVRKLVQGRKLMWSFRIPNQRCSSDIANTSSNFPLKKLSRGASWHRSIIPLSYVCPPDPTDNCTTMMPSRDLWLATTGTGGVLSELIHEHFTESATHLQYDVNVRGSVPSFRTLI